MLPRTIFQFYIAETVHKSTYLESINAGLQAFTVYTVYETSSIKIFFQDTEKFNYSSIWPAKLKALVSRYS